MSAPKIAACLIVKNSKAVIEAAIASIRPHVDEINVYDTGSTDGTLELLECLGSTEGLTAVVGQPDPAPIRVRQGEWRDDFAWAREQSFAMASPDCDWLLWLDDDDEIVGAEHLRNIAASAEREGHDGFVFFYDYARENGACVCHLWRERLIRRDAGYAWKGAVHECLLPPTGRQPRLQLVPPAVAHYVHHRPADRYAPTRNLDILLADWHKSVAASELPDARTIAYLGTELMSQQRFSEAAPHLQAYLDHPNTKPGDERCQVYHKLATCLRFLNQPQAALEVEFLALRERDDWSETYVGLMEGFALLGDWPRSERWARRVLELGAPQSMMILNPLEFTLLPMTRLAEAARHQGRIGEAQEWIEKAAALQPENSFVAAQRGEIAQARFEHELVTALLTVREAAVRFDENLQALRLLEAAPYMIRDHPAIVAARSNQRRMVEHFLRPDEYRRWYEDEPKESTVDDDVVDRVGEWCQRAIFLQRGLEEQRAELGRPLRVLDAGCNDYWIGAWLFKHHGHTVDGIELNRSAHAKALERAARFGVTDARIEQGAIEDVEVVFAPGAQDEAPEFDAIYMFEVIEHVIDVDETLAALESVLAPGGRIYISTPDGAFDHGNPPNALAATHKGHLRCMPAHDLASKLLERGKIIDLEPGAGGLVNASYHPGPPKKRVAIWTGAGLEQWSPATINAKGLGGSETAATHLAHQLGEAGWLVEVYADVPNPLIFGQTIWRHYSSFDPTVERDAVVISRFPEAFDVPINAPARVLWCHDHSYPGMTAERAAHMTHIAVLSDWQRKRFAKLYPYTKGKLVVTRNGISQSVLDLPVPPLAEREQRVVYTSSPDRGLDVLVEMWPEIRERCPDAELHVYYGWDNYDRMALHNGAMAAAKAALLGAIAKVNEDHGDSIVMRGRLPQMELAAELRKARVWAYPTHFDETSCISAMEARAAGLACVCPARAALAETVGGRHGLIVPGDDPRHPGFRQRFIGSVLSVLGIEETWETYSQRALAGTPGLAWDERRQAWLDILNETPALAVAA